jgi:hypothetical protein
MALELVNKENVNAPDSDFPFGDVRDKTPTVGGTKYNRLTMSDYIQFFHKMMSEAGITYNNDLDNESNGWQFYEAFRKLTRPYRVISGKISQTGTNDPVMTIHENTLGFTPVASRNGTGIYVIESVGNFAGDNWFSMGNGANLDTKIATSISEDGLLFFVSQFNPSGPSFDLVDGFVINVPFEIRIYD